MRQGNAPLFIRVLSWMYMANDIILSRVSSSDLYMYCLDTLLVEPEAVGLAAALRVCNQSSMGFLPDLGSLVD
jgi:hypothetical protein